MGDLPLRTPIHRCLGRLLLYQLANGTHAYLSAILLLQKFHANSLWYGVLGRLSTGYLPLTGKLHTRYSPVRRSPPVEASFNCAAPRLACVRPVASVHPEPGSNSSLYESLCDPSRLEWFPGKNCRVFPVIVSFVLLSFFTLSMCLCSSSLTPPSLLLSPVGFSRF